MRKRYIRLSKLPQIVLVFFVGKKNGKKQIIQNYRYLNKWIIKNSYSLSLILDIVILSFFIVVPNRELVDILFPFNTSIFSTLIVQNNMNIDIDVNIPKYKSIYSSTNISRELLVHSSISSILYVEKIKAQNNNSSWTNQVKEFNELQGFTLSYTD